MKKYIFLLLPALVLMLACALTGCHTIKKSIVTRDSVRIVLKDSIVLNLIKKDSTVYRLVIKDSAVGISGSTVAVDIPANSDKNIVIKNGNTTLRTHIDNKGNRHIDCTSDSLTIVINNLTREYSYAEHKVDSLKSVVSKSDTKVSHEKETVTEKAKWYVRLWNWIKTPFAIIGLVWLVVFIVKKILKR